MASNTPQPAFNFQVEAGLSRIGFSRVQLPTLDREVIRYRDGADRVETVRLIPGVLHVGECVLERGVVPPDNEFFQWLNSIGGGKSERRDVVVKLLDASHAPIMTWKLRNAFPSALQWSMLDAQNNAVLIETLRLAVESVDVESS